MSRYGTKVVAVLDTQSAFGVTIKQMRDNIISLQDSFNTLTGLAPGSLDSLAEIATAIQDLQTRTNTLESNPNVYTVAGGVLGGNVTVQKDFPDVELKSNQEKRFLFSDAGGGATGAIKNITSDVEIYAGGVANANKALTASTSGVNVVDRLTTGQFNIPTTVPASPVDGDLYFDKVSLALKIYVDDGNSTQWVQL
jgi:hypothetical protein